MSFTSVTEPQPSLAWQFENSNVDYVSSLSPSYSTVSGALTSLPTFVSGKYNQAIRLAQTAANAGANTYVLWSLAASPISIDTTGITIACWVNWTTLSGSLVSMYDAFTNVLGIYMTSTLTYTGRGFSGTQALTNATSNTATNSVGVWYHIALTYNSTSVILYKNGVGGAPVATGSPGVTITGIRIGSQANNINPTYVGYACSDCAIDDLRIYNTALTAAQVQSVYSSQGAPAPSRAMPLPTLAWDFNGTTTDYVSGLTGTTTGTATYNSGGKYGQSLIMNGSSYVKYSKTLGYNLGTGGATFAMWFKLLAIPVGTNFWIFGASGTSYSDRIYILVGTTGYITFAYIDNTLAGKGLNSPSALVVGAWTHLTFTLFNGTMTMYVNGAQVATRSDAPMSGVVLDTQFSIAALAGGSAENINAEYDDFRIFDRALTSIQVNDIYNQQGVPGRGVQTLAYPYDNVGITSSAAGLWSTRRLRSAYAGPVVNVRRNSDNSQLDFIADQFGNLSNVQSAVTIDAWLTSTTGNVTTWYDQFRSNNFTQTTATSQPQIVKNAGKWVVFFNRDNLTGVPTFYSRMTIPNQISGIKTILYGINTLADTFETLLGQSGVDNAGFRMIGGDFFIGAYGNDRNDFLYTGGRDNRGNGFYLTYWYNNNKYGSSLNIVNDSNPLNQWGLVIGSTPGYTSFGFNSLSDGFSNRAFYGYLSEVAMFTDQISQVDAGSLYADQYISRTISSTLTGVPLFNQLSPAATSSAVGAFSLRAVNGVSARAVQVRPVAAFPPAAMSSNGPQNLTGYPFGGGGSYTASASSQLPGYGDTTHAFRAFDSDPTNATTWHSEIVYDASGNYTGVVSTAGYSGEWLQIQMPSTTLYSYSMITRQYYDLRSPNIFYILGSNNGTDWILVDSQSGITGWTWPTRKTFIIASPVSTSFIYFRLVINKTNGPNSVQISSFILNGTLSGSSADFYADDRGNLLTAPVTGTTLQNWLGSATGYVTTWYDQSGRGNHMSCSSAGIQPKIDTTNAWLDFKTAAYFDTSANPASGPVPYSNTMNYTIICRHNTIGNGSGGICGSAQTNNNNYTNNFRRAGSAYQSYWYNNDQTAGTYATGNRVTFKWDGTNRYIYGNGTLQATTASSNWWQTSSSTQLIGKTTADVTMNGEMYSIFMFTTALSDTDRTLLENFL